MGNRMGRLAKATKRIIAPVVFAAMLPLYSTVSALPRNPTIVPSPLKDSNASEIKKRSRLKITAAIDMADGKIVEQELCAKKFDVLSRRHKLIQKKDAKKGEAELIFGLLFSIQVMLEASRNHRYYSKSDMQRLVLSSIKTNLHTLQKISKTNPKIVRMYFRTIGLLGLIELRNKLRQGFNNPDVIKLYQDMSAIVCRQKR